MTESSLRSHNFYSYEENESEFHDCQSYFMEDLSEDERDDADSSQISIAAKMPSENSNKRKIKLTESLVSKRPKVEDGRSDVVEASLESEETFEDTLEEQIDESFPLSAPVSYESLRRAFI